MTEGARLRVLVPWRVEKVGNVFVVESSFDSLAAFSTALSEMVGTAEGSAWVASVKALELHEPTKELLRVVT